MKSNELERAVRESFVSPRPPSTAAKRIVAKVIARLDAGTLRVATPGDGDWTVHDWVKMAVLLFFRGQQSKPIRAGALSFFDKIPVKKWTARDGVRVAPHAVVRYGACVEKGVVLMPSYVNIGAFVGSGTMVDTWATVGSCAQVGRNVHLSGGVGIGGVLEPVQARPVIIEDEVFIGSRCVVVEGVRVERAAVLGAGVVLTASTKIIDVTGPTETTYQGRIPPRAVVIPGSRPKTFPAGTFSVPCALIVGYRSDRTESKVSLNAALRDFEVSV
jgi:2,3,4,5-tetrahydropyridine-2-carboxylate N-succinyltransferase